MEPLEEVVERRDTEHLIPQVSVILGLLIEGSLEHLESILDEELDLLQHEVVGLHEFGDGLDALNSIIRSHNLEEFPNDSQEERLNDVILILLLAVAEDAAE
jgi:hypothetical protein